MAGRLEKPRPFSAALVNRSPAHVPPVHQINYAVGKSPRFVNRSRVLLAGRLSASDATDDLTDTWRSSHQRFYCGSLIAIGVARFHCASCQAFLSMPAVSSHHIRIQDQDFLLAGTCAILLFMFCSWRHQPRIRGSVLGGTAL